MHSTLIVILNWNEALYTSRCMLSFVPQLGQKDAILVIDNHSTEDPTDFLIDRYASLRIIRTNQNLGVAGGRNIGIRHAIDNKFDYVLLIDNDAYAAPQFLTNLVHAIEKYPDTAIVGPKIYMEHDKKRIWRVGCTSWKWTYLHAGFIILNRFCRFLKKSPPGWIDTGRGEDQKDTGQFDIERDISFQIGCAQLIRTDVFKQIGLLDTEFSPYGSEDIDFCDRLIRHGWKIKYIPEAICWHRAKKSFKNNYTRNFMNTRNILLLARKNLHPLYFAFLFIPDFLFLTIPLMLMEGLVSLQKHRLRGILAGIEWNLRDIRKRGLLITTQAFVDKNE